LDAPDQTTPRKRLEHDLQDALARYRAILASTLDPVVTIDADGVIQEASDSVQRVFGWKPDKLIGKSVNALMPTPHRSKHDEYLFAYRQTRIANILGRTLELEAVRRDGTPFPIELSVSRVDVPGEGDPLFTGIIRDITARKRAEQALKESEQRFRDMLEGVELLAVMLDTQGHITFCNDHLLRLTERTRLEVLGRNWFDLFVPPEEVSRVWSGFRRGVAEGTITPQAEHGVLTQSGERRLIAWSTTVMRDSQGTVVGVTGLGVDITERRRAEEELRRHREHLEELVAERTGEVEASHEQLRLADRLASIGTLAAGLGHDMNNVLLPLTCRLDALESKELPAAETMHIDAVRKSVEYLQQLADGLHLLSLDPEDAEASTEGTDLSSWWEQVGPLLARGLPKRVRLATAWPSDVPPVAVAPHRLTQAVLNLVVNAGEAVGEQGKVRVWAEPLEDGRFVRLGVTDNGHGMSPEVRRRALDPFFTTKKRGLGTGLGLSLVHGVARSAGGSVHIDSAPGKGATIRLTLPAHLPEGSKRALATATPAAVVSIRDRRVASFVSTLLGAAGFSVRYDESGAPGPSALWVTEPSPPAVQEARKYVRESKRQVLVLGKAPTEWSRLGAIIVDDPDDFEALRERIRDAAVSLIGAVP
jgi:PAS domain S-box-containing protein